MKKGIVLKLFVLTTALCMLILAIIFIGQTIFFKQYYANQKINEIKSSMQSFKKEYLNKQGNLQFIQKLTQDFYKGNSAYIALLDSNGNLKNVNDFYIEVKVDYSEDKEFRHQMIRIPLDTLIDIEDITDGKFDLTLGKRVFISGLKKEYTLLPYRLSLNTGDEKWENKQIDKKLNEIHDQDRNLASSKTFISGTLQKVQIPEENLSSNINYTNRLFMERIKAFQVNLLFNEKNDMRSNSTKILDYMQNDIKYKLLIEPIKEKDGATTYIFVMTSLQPVDEAVQMIQDYYMYIIIFVLILVLFASFYYSKGIAKPLLRINNTTQKMANLDFSEKIPITSKDEIGALSSNINTLSNTLHSYINQLQQDIEKEKQLENTRKEFIAGVSHELKTPLSIMKSCISILKDGVASHKKDYYFEAMAKEVDKMDILIVDMLHLAKFESGTYKMDMDIFYIDQLIEQICEHLSLEITNKELQVNQNLSKVEVIANRHRIEQVLTNFITNAIRYTPEKEKIVISTTQENYRVKICVENKGAHIPKEQLEKIWDRFYRTDVARQRSKGGTGLGLAISKNILELHGVEYGVFNTEDGVLFFFYLNIINKRE
ncbi:HAMP domain-containing protein [Bacillus sp. WL1]|uniref:sensor histidine kinase n=1 Tax=unclassified Bacillus (in: firmicutes) TaxID=185979 RepID=UPI001B32ADB1|nr:MULTISPECIES: HAMP domain-containing sensor histidine kinase [unclassified Bacillus (in: firmicutes)]MBP3971430.1 HAMP domain-containing protein [Bacillus sp. WL1]UOB82049.1 ATP-binding protein [Bacillus sp. ZJS3]